MKIKSLLAYSVPLSVLFFVVLTVLVSAPAEPRSVKACRHLPGCVAVVPAFQGWPSVR